MDGEDTVRRNDIDGRGGDRSTVPAAQTLAADPTVEDPAAEIVQLAARLIRLQSNTDPTGPAGLRDPGGEPRRAEGSSASAEGPAQSGRQAALRSGIEVLRGVGVSLVGELRDALERDAFHYVYQPIVSVVSGAVEGYEALIRWRRGTEILTPALFLPVAEETRLIAAIQQRLLDDVAAVYARLAAPTFIAINWSPAQLADTAAVSALVQRVAQLKLQPDRLVIEITRRSEMIDPNRSRDHIRILKDGGFRIALDDFGSGYGSLASLGALPIDLVKIGRPLIRDVGRSARAAVILKGILDMAHELGHRVVAEGVESAEQLTILRQVGCELAQGHQCGRPAREPMASGPA